MTKPGTGNVRFHTEPVSGFILDYAVQKFTFKALQHTNPKNNRHQLKSSVHFSEFML